MNSGGRKLVVFLSEPLSTYRAKGEIKPRYYNPGSLFSEVHFMSPASHDIPEHEVQILVGDAKLVIHSLGRWSAKALRLSGPIGSLLRTIQPHVLRAYDPGIRGALAVRWARHLRIPAVISIHSEPDEQRRIEPRPAHYLRRVFERYTVPRADAVICVSRYVESYARRYGARRIEVIYNRVDAKQFTPVKVPRTNGGTHAAVILCVGRLTAGKNQECLVRAVHTLDARLVLVGGGPLRGALERLVAQLDMADRVTFVDAVEHRQIARYYHEADIFAIATRFEGFCIPVLEAMAAGLPVVASGIEPLAEILGGTGVLVDNEPRAFAVALDALIKNPDRRRDLGRLAMDRALTMDGALMEDREKMLYLGL